jgi:hypothetical protein
MTRKKRIPRPARCPTLVALQISPEVEITERMAYQAFVDGWADKHKFNVLADCRDLLTLAASSRDDKPVMAVCDVAGIALDNIKDRYLQLNKFGATGEELKALRALLDVSSDWWKRQSGNLFAEANYALDRARGFQRTAK